ncbi:MAG: ATP-dependent helicase [Desulfovibrio sp.]|nr:ATP-dependent helicase [Desulfovibrio sp.]
MLDYANSLNSAQYEAVSCDDDAVLVVAGAGSGKTRTIVWRLAWILEHGADPRSILLLTFTRKASQEMLERAGRLLERPAQGVAGGTFHSFAFSVLRRYPPAWLGERPFTLLDPSDASQIIRQLKDNLKLGKGDSAFPKAQTIADILSKARNKELSIEEILGRDSFHLLPYAPDIVAIGNAYKDYKREKALLDYDDLLFELEDVLKSEAGERARERYQYVLVDEYQDTNLVQARIVQALAGQDRENGPPAKVMAVGDEAQSIYAFRGANVRNMLDFQNAFPRTRIIPLEENYRSTQPILDVANNILSRSEESFKKKLYTAREGGAEVRIISPISDATQADLVAERIGELLTRYRPNEIAVLFRSGFHSYQLENSLRRDGVPFRKYGGVRFTEAAHIKDLFAFARLIVNPLDAPAFSRLAAMHKGAGPKTAEKLYNLMAKNDLGALEKACRKFPDFLADLRLVDGLRVNPPEPREIFLEIFHRYRPYMERLYPEDWPTRLAGIDEIIQMSANYASLDLFMADMALDAGQDSTESDDCVTLSTVHSAKGLEWSAVLIIDLVEDRFPSRRSVARSEDFEEERRLFYVACTRAKKELELYAPAAIYNKMLQSRTSAIQSPFLRELPSSSATRYAEKMGGVLEKTDSLPVAGATFRVSPFPEPQAPTTEGETKFASRYESSSQGYCRHRIFGRGKIIKKIDDDKLQVNFPGYGLKIILANYLLMED